ncbi:MAG: DUF3575 domain-containing protein [Bacteroidales bacterium]|nr:DUF3575 domain-containing protein [Bacteroidales bacterium]
MLSVLALAALTPCLAANGEAPDSLKTGPGISIRTNLLWDGVAEPNLGIEFPVGEHVTVGANAGLKAWPRWLAWDWDNVENTTHWRNFAVVPEVRYYFDQIYKGFFAGADFLYTHFNVGNVQTPFHMYPDAEDYRVQGSYWAGGLFAGYAWWPWQHWRLELEAGIAAGLAAYDRFDCPHCGTKVGEIRKPALVPKLALNVAYNPVSRDEAQKRKELRNKLVVSGTDTITVLTPPVAFVVHFSEVHGPESAGDKLSKESPWVIPIEKYRPLDYLTRPGKDSILYVQFPVESSILNRDFPELSHRNGKVLDQLEQAIITVRDDPRTTEMLISVVGLASIEGPQVRNDSLAVRRARAVADELNRKTGVSRRFFETIGKGEAWDWLKDQLEAAPDGYERLTADEISKLLDIVYNTPDADRREARIKADARLYQKVKDHLLADQRNAGYIRLYYGTAPDPATVKLNGPIAALLKAKRYHDAVRAIRSDTAVLDLVQSDPEAMNAYGTALYFTALDNHDPRQEVEALRFLQEAARRGSEAAAQNLKGTEKYGPARKEYEAWVEAMKKDN